MKTGRVDVSIVMSTYNRASMLPRALGALLAQSTTVPHEIIVVNNNSTDDTAAVVQTYVEAHPGRVRYVFEGEQGLSYGRNAGIRAARGSIIAFTDDDVDPAADWLERLAAAFAAYPEAAYIGGRVLPRWKTPPPPWLTTAHWSPLALQDYGNAALEASAARPICLVGANLAFRSGVFERVGVFTGRFGRIRDGIGSTEDHDMQLRIWQSGMRGMYVPDVVMLAEIQPDRFDRSYHRRWHRGHGRHCARMRLREIVPADMAPMQSPTDLVMLYGAPAFVYREVALTGRRWFASFVRRGDALFYANRMRFLTSYLAESWRRHRAETGASPVGEVWRFARAYVRKRARPGPAGVAA